MTAADDLIEKAEEAAGKIMDALDRYLAWRQLERAGEAVGAGPEVSRANLKQIIANALVDLHS